MLEELKGGLEAPGCSELLWEDQRETAQLPPSGMVAPVAGAGGVTGNVGSDGQGVSAEGNWEPTYFRYLRATLGCLNLAATKPFPNANIQL